MTSGIDLSYVDHSVRPHDDLFRHVNGRWLDETEIPEDKARYGEFVRLREQAEKQVHAIIERVAASAPAPGTDEQKVADLYRDFMDAERVESLGAGPLRPLL